MLLRVFVTSNSHVLVRVFCIYVRPIIEYCSPTFSSSKISDINLLENVQRSFTKRIYQRARIPDCYFERCKFFNLETFEYRRLIFDLILVYKILHNFTSLNASDYFSFCDPR
jgi:hypothetical protein